MNARVVLLLLALAVAAAVSCVTTGCQNGQGASKITMTGDANASETIASREEAQLQAGALAWKQNCMRCHNLRNPNERSDREWDVIVHHMRVRANLTAEEHRLILRFLQSAN